ncbi:hypothetical protein BCAR13_450003 [Paraburkholderia caribensis]|nr:hypothetical protein BCAR13_450003 [Paraburkholderia caribensis]
MRQRWNGNWKCRSERNDGCPKLACRKTGGSYGIQAKAGWSPKSWLACLSTFLAWDQRQALKH